MANHAAQFDHPLQLNYAPSAAHLRRPKCHNPILCPVIQSDSGAGDRLDLGGQGGSGGDRPIDRAGAAFLLSQVSPHQPADDSSDSQPEDEIDNAHAATI